MAKGRLVGVPKPNATGELNHAAKLTAAEVQSIRARAKEGEAALASAFGVTPQNIRRILKGETWRTT